MPKLYRIEKDGQTFVFNKPDGRITAKDMPNLLQAIFNSIHMGLTNRDLFYADEPSSEACSLSRDEYQEYLRLYRR